MINPPQSKLFSHAGYLLNRRINRLFTIDTLKAGLHPSDALLFLLLLVMAVSLSIVSAFNPVQYPRLINYPLYSLLLFPSQVLLVCGLGLIQKNTSSAFILSLLIGARVFFHTAFIFLITSSSLYALILTPLPPIDHQLVHLDSLLHFHLPHFMRWSQQHLRFYRVMKLVYASWLNELIVLPVLASFFLPYCSVMRYFVCLLLAMSIAALIYFFFPTASPASVFKAALFLPEQHAIVHRYYNFHHQVVQSIPILGLISFPSPHVIGALSVTLLFWRRWGFFIPMALFNALVCLSTLALGYHYLVDVIASFCITPPCFWLAHYLLKKTEVLW